MRITISIYVLPSVPSDTKANNNGVRLLQLCSLEGLTITNTYFQQKNKHKATWQHQRSKRWHLIDYIIVRSERRTEIKKCRVMRGAEIDTDHRLVRATAHMKNIIYKKRKPPECSFSGRYLQNEDIKQKFYDTISRCKPDLTNTNVEDAWSKIKEAYHSVAARTVEKKKRQCSDWFDECDHEIKVILEAKRKAHEIFLSNPSKENKKEYQAIRRKSQASIRKIRDTWWVNKTKKLQSFIDKGDSYNLYQGIKELVGPTKRPLNILETENGNRIENLKDRLQQWGNYFEKLYNQETETDCSALNITLNVEHTLEDNPPTHLKDALLSLKNNKSPGSDNIIGEMLKAGQETTIDLFHYLFEKIWTKKSIPKEWTEALVVPIHKKGKKSRCENYRGISLLSVPSKLLCKVLYNRLYPHIETLLKDTQCGFRREKSTIDMIFTSRQLVE